ILFAEIVDLDHWLHFGLASDPVHQSSFERGQSTDAENQQDRQDPEEKRNREKARCWSADHQMTHQRYQSGDRVKIEEDAKAFRNDFRWEEDRRHKQQHLQCVRDDNADVAIKCVERRQNERDCVGESASEQYYNWNENKCPTRVQSER